MPDSTLRALFAALAGITALGCSSSTDSPGTRLTHPVGVVDAIDSGVVSAHGIAIAHSGATILTRFAIGDAVVGRADELTFGPGITGLPFPLDAAITPDEKTAFVPLAGNSRTAIVDMTTGAHSDDLSTDINFTFAPLRALVTPDGNRLYVTSDGNNGEVSDTAATIYSIDAHTHVLIDSIVIQGRQNGIAYDASARRLYVSSGRASAVYEIDANTDVVRRKLPAATSPQDVAITRDRSELWVATEGTSGVQVIELATGRVSSSIPGTDGAFGLAISPDGERVYVTRPTKHNFVIIDAGTRMVLDSIAADSSPTRVVFDATGAHAYITDDLLGLVRIR